MMEGRRLESVPEHQTLADQDTGQRITKAEPVTASQQISLWLMRASTQDIYQDLGKMDTFRRILRSRTESVRSGELRKCETEVKFRIESDQEDEEEEEEEEPVSLKKKRSKTNRRASRNKPNNSLMKHFGVKGMRWSPVKFS